MREHPSPNSEQFPQPLPPLSHEELMVREKMESDPSMYTTKVYPDDFLTGSTDIEEGLASLASGFIDFRNTVPTSADADPNVIWIGYDHYEIAAKGAHFPHDENMKDYMVGIKTAYDEGRQKLIIMRGAVGQSCDRSPEHLAKALDAVEIAINRDIIQSNNEMQSRYFLRAYGLPKNLSDKNVLSEVEPPDALDLKTTTSEPYDLALLPEIDGHMFEGPKEAGTDIDILEKKVLSLVPHMRQDERASIRIPFKLVSRTENRDDINITEENITRFVRGFEKNHADIASEVVYTRSALHRKGLPGEQYGYILFVPGFSNAA